MSTAEGLMLNVRNKGQKTLFGGTSTSYTQYYDWHDYTTINRYSYDSKTQKTTLKSTTNEIGAKRGSSLSSILNPFRVTRESEAIKRYDGPKQESPFWKYVREKTRGGGIQWTSKDWTFAGQTTEYNARALFPDGRSESIDDLIAPSTNTVNNIGDAVKYLWDGINLSRNLKNVKEIKLFKEKSTWCETCGQNISNSDTSGHDMNSGIKPKPQTKTK